ncbi:MAG: universal stress protein [Gammaproteobacteria bacterium]
MPYKHILLAIDFFDQQIQVAERAKELADLYGARLGIMHVVDTLPITDPANDVLVPFEMDLSQEFIELGRKKLTGLAAKLAIPEERIWLETGSPRQEILRIAEENGVDLIVVGSHGRHGLALLLGSTANGILHHANCDVLAVRLKGQ